METAATQRPKIDWDLEMARRGSKSAVERLVMREREFRAAIEPYLKIKMEVYSLALPRITVYPDGRVTGEYDWTPEQEETLRLVDEVIAMVSRMYGITSA